MPNRMVIGRTTFRESTQGDRAGIMAVEELAYGRKAEAALADELIAAPVDTISLVAELDGAVVGHVLLTRILGPEAALALAPLAVHPAWRDCQIGTELTRRALATARERGWKSVFVLGQPDYYGRFGFKSHLADGADIEWQGRRFLALELEPGALAGWSGKLTYPEAFGQL